MAANLTKLFESVYLRVYKVEYKKDIGYDFFAPSEMNMSKERAVDYLRSVITDAEKAIELLEKE